MNLLGSEDGLIVRNVSTVDVRTTNLGLIDH